MLPSGGQILQKFLSGWHLTPLFISTVLCFKKLMTMEISNNIIFNVGCFARVPPLLQHDKLIVARSYVGVEVGL